jgi:hypothetical protein
LLHVLECAPQNLKDFVWTQHADTHTWDQLAAKQRFHPEVEKGVPTVIDIPLSSGVYQVLTSEMEANGCQDSWFNYRNSIPAHLPSIPTVTMPGLSCFPHASQYMSYKSFFAFCTRLTLNHHSLGLHLPKCNMAMASLYLGDMADAFSPASALSSATSHVLCHRWTFIDYPGQHPRVQMSLSMSFSAYLTLF